MRSNLNWLDTNHTWFEKKFVHKLIFFVRQVYSINASTEFKANHSTNVPTRTKISYVIMIKLKWNQIERPVYKVYLCLWSVYRAYIKWIQQINLKIVVGIPNTILLISFFRPLNKIHDYLCQSIFTFSNKSPRRWWETTFWTWQ